MGREPGTSDAERGRSEIEAITFLPVFRYDTGAGDTATDTDSNLAFLNCELQIRQFIRIRDIANRKFRRAAGE